MIDDSSISSKDDFGKSDHQNPGLAPCFEALRLADAMTEVPSEPMKKYGQQGRRFIIHGTEGFIADDWWTPCIRNRKSALCTKAEFPLQVVTYPDRKYTLPRTLFGVRYVI
jgi:hypothetical protein